MTKYINILKKDYPDLYILCVFSYDGRIFAVLSMNNSYEENNVDSAGYVFDGSSFELDVSFWKRLMINKDFYLAYEKSLEEFRKRGQA